MTREERLQISKEIYRQLGGHKFAVMTGLTNLVAIDNGIQFNFKGCRKYNKCVIKLNAMDTYDMFFYRCSKLGYKKEEFTPKYEANMVYDDMLTNIFKEQTGLNTSL